MTVSFHVRRMLYLSALVFSVYLCVHLVRTQLGYNFIDDLDRDARLREINKSLQSSRTGRLRGVSNGQACRHPRLDVFAPELMRHVRDEPPIECGGVRDWVAVEGSTARVTDEARAAHGDVECAFTDVVRENDHNVHDGVTTTTHTEYNLEESDFVRVRCKSQAGAEWQSVLAGIRHDQDVRDRTGWDKLPRDALRMNVLMFGFDSLARNMFIRKLPKSYAFLHDTLQGVTLEGYNIVGDGTPQALIPILTGRTELELPETRKRMGDRASYVNVYPFVWKDYQANGYVTAYLEDQPNIGTFTYRLKGFNSPPTDHYMRPYYMAASKEYANHKKLCVGSLPRHKILLNYIGDFFRVYRAEPKFLFAFHAELSHDSYNLIGAADDDMLEWLQSLRDDGHLNNTLLVVMSDHGHRFTNIRNTQQGKQEERMPFFTFVFPPWFERSHPDAMRTFRTNAGRLTTPFDIYPTLRHVLHYEAPTAVKPTSLNRSLSLFHEIPLERTCGDAGIEPHWCACLEWQEVSLQDPLVLRAGQALVDFINKYTSEYRDICAPLTMDRVQWAAKLSPGAGLLKFRKNADLDGFVPDLSARTPVSRQTYQVKVATQPGGGLFEASPVYNMADDTFGIKITDISRINRYGSQAHCVYEKYAQLRKYCYCKAPPPQEEP